MAEPIIVKLVGDGSCLVEVVKAIGPFLGPVLSAVVGGFVAYFSVRLTQNFAAKTALEQLNRTHELELLRINHRARVDLALPVILKGEKRGVKSCINTFP